MKKTLDLYFLELLTKMNLKGKLRILLRKRNGVIKRSRKYLKAGKYKYNEAGNMLYLESRPEDLEQISPTYLQYHHKKSKKRKKYLFVDENSHQASGTLLVFSTSERIGKVFDFEHNKLISCYSSLKEFELVKRKRSLYSDCYQHVPNWKYDEKGWSFIEDRLPSCSFSSEEALFTLVKIYCTSIKRTQYTNKSYDRPVKRFESIYQVQLADEFYEEQPTILCHGDLWSGNVIYSNEKYYFIDFDDVDYDWFAYDIFTYIIWDQQVKNDDYMIIEYLKGSYDLCMKELFESVSRVYHPSYKKKYMLFFLALVSNRRWKYNYERKVWVDEIIKKYNLNE